MCKAQKLSLSPCALALGETCPVGTWQQKNTEVHGRKINLSDWLKCWSLFPLLTTHNEPEAVLYWNSNAPWQRPVLESNYLLSFLPFSYLCILSPVLYGSTSWWQLHNCLQEGTTKCGWAIPPLKIELIFLFIFKILWLFVSSYVWTVTMFVFFHSGWQMAEETDKLQSKSWQATMQNSTFEGYSAAYRAWVWSVHGSVA